MFPYKARIQLHTIVYIGGWVPEAVNQLLVTSVSFVSRFFEGFDFWRRYGRVGPLNSLLRDRFRNTSKPL